MTRAGTGKTYASAFAVRELEFKRIKVLSVSEIKKARLETDDLIQRLEAEADTFSQNTLIPKAKYDEFVMMSSRGFTAEIIRSFASRINVLLGIVVGRLQHDGYLTNQTALNSLKVKYVIGCTEAILNYCELENMPYIAIKLDRRIPHGNSEIWGQDLGFPGSIVYALNAISRNQSALLVLDQLDALRWTQANSSEALSVCMEIIRQAGYKTVLNDSIRREAITKKQERAFLKFIKDDPHFSKYYECIYILFKTGMRISEFCGLTIHYIDMKERTIDINHQLQRLPDMEYSIEPTKTNAGKRVLPMTLDVYECFKTILKNRKAPKKEPMIGKYV